MIGTYGNRIFGLVGAIRTGKDSVANFLIETRDFKRMAFADQIKEEFGISKADFEAAKIAGNIEELREKLWAFSAAKKKDDPLYFIKKVIDKARSHEGSVIITDIRTEEELSSFFDIDLGLSQHLKRVYWVKGDFEQEVDDKGRLNGSKLLRSQVTKCQSIYNTGYRDLRCIYNDEPGLYRFYQYLDKFFFTEDIEDIWNNPVLKGNVRGYLDQFEIKVKERNR